MNSMRAISLMTLLAVGAAVSVARADDKAVKTPEQKLFHSILQNEVANVKALLNTGINPNARVKPDKEDAWYIQRPEDDQSPPLLVVAASFGAVGDDSAIVQMLLEKGADTNVKDRQGITPLMKASQLGWATSMRMLLEHGAKVNVKDADGRTPLMFSMGNRGISAAAVLLDKGAEVNAKDSMGQTALMYALRNAQQDPIRLYGQNRKEDEPEMIPDITKPTGKDGKLKMIRLPSATERYLELIKFLIDKGADVNAKTKDGMSVLKIAMTSGKPQAVAMLKKAGAKE
jgi:ankyrin repeat protein